MSVVTLIPYDRIPSELLVRLLEDFISREGTDYGVIERTMEEKVSDLRTQLQRGEVKVIFDGESETFTLITAQEAKLIDHDHDD